MASTSNMPVSAITFGPFAFDPATRWITRRGTKRQLVLAPQPAAILHHLLKKKGRVAKREKLYDALRGALGTNPEPKIVDVQVNRLRRALNALSKDGRFHVVTVWATGYRVSEIPVYHMEILRRKRGGPRESLRSRLWAAHREAF